MRRLVVGAAIVCIAGCAAVRKAAPAAHPAPFVPRSMSSTAPAEAASPVMFQGQDTPPQTERRPDERVLLRAGSIDLDLRALPRTVAVPKRERPEHDEPVARPRLLPTDRTGGQPVEESVPAAGGTKAPAPGASINFDGLSAAAVLGGTPPDTNGDVGPNHVIEAVNTSVGIYTKTGALLVAFSFDDLMSQGHFGNLCDTENHGDPVVLYDTFEDRWIITDFAWPNGAGEHFQCFAVSKTGDPVAGGWNFYSISTQTLEGDYPKFGIWPDGLYMSANMFDYPGPTLFVRLYAFNKAQMYAGAPTVQVVSFDFPSKLYLAPSDWTLLPANARLQTGTPLPGSPNYFTSVWNYQNAISVWKFHVDWSRPGASTLTGPINVATTTAWSLFTGSFGRVPSPAQPLDTLYPKLMQQNQFSYIGGIGSLWNSHTVGASGASSSQASIRYYEIGVFLDTVTPTAIQASTYSPADTLHRFMPSVAVNRNGDMAIGYNAVNATTNPAIRYAGRLVGDAVNTISLTETSLVEGGGSQTTSSRWGDYATMTLDPDGCTFWQIGEYFQTAGASWNTRIGAFAFPGCIPSTTGTLTGTIKNSSNLPLAGATVALGVRTTTTNGSGVYTFAGLPAGSYPGLAASLAGYGSTSVPSVFVNSGGTTTKNLTLFAAAASGCFVDTTQTDFQAYFSSSCDVATSPGSAVLPPSAPFIDQQNTNYDSTGKPFSSAFWAGQTFVPSVTGKLTRAEFEVFCSVCSGTLPDLTVSIRATNGTVPTGVDLSTATIAGGDVTAFSGMFPAIFASPATLTAGTTYALIIRAVSNPPVGTYAFKFSASNPYPGGQRVASTDSGVNWMPDATTDFGFKIFMQSGFATSGTFVSSLKDANPGVGRTATWSAISWNAAVPGGTTLKIQVAASNSVNGPFTFVGPDNTANTYFTSGASLAQFNGKRYVRYMALLTSSGTLTPTLNDVTVCYSTAPRPVLDLNGDGSGDVFTYASLTGAWARQISQPGGGFVEQQTGGWAPGWTVTPAYFNADTMTDVFLSNAATGQWFKLLNDGTGFTTESSGYWWPGWQKFVMDLSGDGISDLFLYDPVTGQWYKSVSIPGGFTYSSGWWNPGWEISIMNLNADAFDDLFLIDRTTGRWFWVYGEAGADFSYPQVGYWAPDWSLYPGDFNGDGRGDLFLYRPNQGQYYVALNNGAGYNYTAGYGWAPGWTPYVGDFDGDGRDDLFLYSATTGAWFEMTSNGTGGFSVGGNQTWTTGWQLYPTHLNDDGRTDFLLYDPISGFWYQARNLVTGSFSYSSGFWAPNLTIITRAPIR